MILKLTNLMSETRVSFESIELIKSTMILKNQIILFVILNKYRFYR